MEGRETMAIPLQFVLTSSDGVNVEFSDGSLLELSPCGSSFQYHAPPERGGHPLLGLRTINQKTEFTISTYRPYVKTALDFRNRFAERPFVCRHLCAKSDIQRMYADIDEIAWPSRVSDACIERLPCGSVRLLSLDEYASVTLPLHRRDFTVQYLAPLSGLSPDHNNSTLSVGDISSITATSSQQSHIGASLSLQELSNTSQNRDGPGTNVQNTNNHHDNNPNNKLWNVTTSSSHTNCNFDVGAENGYHQLKSAGDKTKGQGPELSTPQQNSTDSGHDASAHCSPGRKWEYVWMAQHFSVKECPAHWQHALDLLLEHTKDPQGIDSSPESGKLNTEGNENHRKGECKLEDGKKYSDITPELLNCGKNNSEHNVTNSNLTQYSLNSEKDRNVAHNAMSDTTVNRQLRRVLKKSFSQCVYSTVPKSLALNCKNQHKHRWTVVKEGVVVNTYHEGRVKVICQEGIIYRLLWRHPRSVEVYPGDGSVVESRGMTSQYFAHYKLKLNGGRKEVEERMYCMTSLPPTTSDDRYSISSILTSASRYLEILSEENLQLYPKIEAVCWKDTDSREASPTHSSVVLVEESTVEGMGRFTAYSNGLVRVLYSDRTSLEMVVDLQGDGSVQGVGRNVLGLPEGSCRLMLRNGHYHTVEADNPGRYERYISPALEWAQWVSTSPSDRYNFYKDTIHDPDKQGSVESELKKIRCFNYIVENTCPSKHTAARDGSPCTGLGGATGIESPSQTWSCEGQSTAQEMDMNAVRDALLRTTEFLKNN